MRVTKFECDGCGVVHGHKTEMQEINVRFESGKWYDTSKYDMHLCLDCCTESLGEISHILADRPRGEVKGVIEEGGYVWEREDLHPDEFEEDREVVSIMDDIEEYL